MERLVCVGDNVADYYPEEKILYPGGSAYNVAVLARRYGAKTAYLGTFGSDIAGKYLIEVLEAEGVDNSHISIIEGRNAISRVVNKDGQSQIVNVDKGVYKEFSLSKKELGFVQRFDFLHTTAYSYTEEYLPLLKRNGFIISFDYSFRTDLVYLEQTSPYVDIAFFSAVGINGDIREFMVNVSELGPEQVVVTMGKKGVLAFHNKKFYCQPAVYVRVVDTLGAGDAFIAMYLRSLGKGFSIPEILEKASKKAADCCKVFGSIGRGKKDREGRFSCGKN